MGFSDKSVFNLQHYFATNPFTAVHEVLYQVHSDMFQKKTTVFRQVEKFMETGNVCDRKHVRIVTFLTHDRAGIVEGTLSKLPHKSFRILLFPLFQLMHTFYTL
jgi:hypothetical protein